MTINTASAAISLARKLETESAAFYEKSAERFPQGREVFASFAKENGRNVVQFERAYYSVITDALEGCFAFKIVEDNYTFDTQLESGDYSAALTKALEIEDRITKFYVDAAEQSRGLMADVPKAFLMIAKRRSSRAATLRSLLA